ncbi:MAG: M4 family metallopeptidase [Actinomycetota bacterium]|nr:M4 family metallopeptidase [Actinomycetota bacterium]MDQ3575741.1 M4 family metallopeptidase [Actinomycetota bacterium]
MRRTCGTQCFIPPHVLARAARNGNDEQRSFAVQTLLRDQTIRMARLQNAKVRAGGPREGADALAVQARPRPNRIIRDARGGETVDGRVVRKEGEGPIGDEAADQAYDALGDTFTFFVKAYGRNSIDDAGMPLRGVVHYGQQYANAFWDGKRMVFGDGDGVLFSSLTGSLDVIGHELTHGVIEDEAELEYLGQSGALNESVSDVFGSLVKQYKLRQRAEDADWLIGPDVFSPGIRGDALRSMKAPGTAYDDPALGNDDQPADMDHYLETVEDNGGVHINSGIPNHAFYVTATTLGGWAWERAGRIWYDSLRDAVLKPTADFATFAATTLLMAERTFGRNSEEVDAVKAGWEKVKVAPTG